MNLYNGYVDMWRESDLALNKKICIIAAVYFWRKRPEYIMYNGVKYLGKNQNGNYILQDNSGNKIEDDIIRIICWGYKI